MKAADVTIDILVEAGEWPDETELAAIARRAVDGVMAEIGAAPSTHSELSVVFTDDAHIRTLNAGMARQGQADQRAVLSGLSGAAPARRCRRCLATSCWPPKRWRAEARNEGKPLADHMTHLIVHGILHLIGYDHETDAEAEVMEQAERRILAGLAIPDPYTMIPSGEHQTAMNENTPTAPGPEAGGDSKASNQSADGPSTTQQRVPPSRRAPNARRLFERLTSFFRQRNGSNLREDIADALAESASDEAAFSPAERAMLNNILRFREVRVEDVMVPRADIEAVEINTTLGALMNLFEESGHSRMPVYAETLDDPRGMVHIRDIVAHITRIARVKKATRSTRKPADAAELNLGNVDLSKTIGELSLTRTVLFVPPSMLAADLMARMQATRTQMALVIDEYGGTDGLVSLEDIVEMVVGDIEDEHDDQDEPLITEAGDGVFVVDGKAEIDEVAKVDRRCVLGRRARRDGRHDRRHDLQHARSGAGARRGRPRRSRLRVPRARRRPAPGQARAHRRGRQGRTSPACRAGPRRSTTSSVMHFRISRFGAIASGC